uniref:CLIP domain-containing serine protease n=1 Tax=Anopheles culicifacies TaxID=139723 RepID=A0A182M5S0_9DIPT
MIHLRFAVLKVYALLLPPLVVFGQVNQACFTTTGEPARCVPLVECPAIAELASRAVLYRGENRKLKALFGACDSASTATVPIVCCESPRSGRLMVGTTTTIASTVPIPRRLIHAQATTISTTTVRTKISAQDVNVLPSQCGVVWRTPEFHINTDVTDNDNEHPWLVYLEMQKNPKAKGTSRCVGTLIHESFVLTAAHCMYKLSTESIKLFFGKVDIAELEQCLLDYECEERRAKKLITHNNYNKHNRLNDIGLIQLSQPIQTSEHVAPACLPLHYKFDESVPGDARVVALGWGETEHGLMSDEKRIVMLNVIPQDECHPMLLENQRLNDTALLSFMCTVGYVTGQDVCNGDSGAPLLHLHNKRYFAVGVVSFGPKCGMADVPGFSMRISEYMEWILEQLMQHA